jgi:hypothetical protein
VATALTTKEQRRTAIRLVLFASVPVSLLALLQQLHVAGVPHLLAQLTDAQDYVENTGVSRATGPFAIWHDLGSYSFVVVLLGVALLTRGSGRIMSFKPLLAITGLAAITLVSTVSFTPIIGVVVGSLALMPRAQRSKGRLIGFAVFAVVVSLVFAPALSGRYQDQFARYAPIQYVPFLPQNFNFRLYVWTHEYVPLLRQNLTTGYGPDLPPHLRFPYTESVYVTLLLRGGLPLLVVYGGLMLAIALRARELRNHPDPDRQAIARVLFIIAVILVFLQLVQNYFVNAGFPHLFWLLAGLLAAERGRAAEHVRAPIRAARASPVGPRPRAA